MKRLFELRVVSEDLPHLGNVLQGEAVEGDVDDAHEEHVPTKDVFRGPQDLSRAHVHIKQAAAPDVLQKRTVPI